MANFVGLEGWDRVLFNVLSKIVGFIVTVLKYFLKGLGDIIYDFLADTYRFIVRLINLL